MAGSIRLTVLGALALGSASALQIPLQLPIQLPKLPWASSGGALHGDQLTSKPTIDSEALQNKISVERLQKRAEDLYEIAKTSEEEFNRPTRAIGTQGKLRLDACSILHANQTSRPLWDSRLHSIRSR